MNKRLLALLTALMLIFALAPAALAEDELMYIDEGRVYTIELNDITLPGDYDVTRNIFTEIGGPAFTDTSGVAVTYRNEANKLCLRLDASKITGITFDGTTELYLKSGSKSVHIGKYVAPTLTAENELFGSIYTNGKSTLKAYFGGEMKYTPAVLTASIGDDSLIDGSGAVFTMLEGDGYSPEEYDVTAVGASEYVDGKCRFTVGEGGFNLSTGDYPITDPNSGREWSCLGGDGQGNYRYNVKVSGVKYNGLAVADFTMRLHIYVYGFNYTADAEKLYGDGPDMEPKSGSSGKTSGSTILWMTENDESIVLCDRNVDNIYVVWPNGVNAAGYGKDDVKITLRSTYGDEIVLDKGDYTVYSSINETQIAIKYINWAFVPVYTTMTVEVAGESKTFDVASVYVYEVQQGGGGTRIDGTVTAYSFYGFKNLTDIGQIMSPSKYILKTEISGETVYYGENGTLVTDIGDAAVFTDEDENQRLIGNTCYVTAKDAVAEERTVDGSTRTFERVYTEKGGLLSPDGCDPALEPMDGYIIPKGTDNWITNEKWAWQSAVAQGWTGITVTPSTERAAWTVEHGSFQQFTANREGVSWKLVGAPTDPATSVDENGVVTVGMNETGFFGVCAYIPGDEYAQGTVQIKTTPSTGNKLVGIPVTVTTGSGRTAEIKFMYSGVPATSLRGEIDTALDIISVDSEYNVEFYERNNRFIVYTADTFRSGDVLFTVTVDLSKPLPQGDYEIGVTVLDATDDSAADIDVASSPAVVTVSGEFAYLKGDVNLDGSVDNADLVTLARCLVALDTVTGQCFENADMNSDGLNNNMDLVLLARLLVG